MVTTSAEFTAASTALIRRPVAKVDITWSDPFIDTSIQATTNNQGRIAWPKQTFNLNEVIPHNWFVLNDSNPPNLGDSLYACPDTEALQIDNEMGWYTGTPCDASAEWSAPYPALTITFSERVIDTLLVAGSDYHSEYPVDFTVQVFGEFDEVLFSEDVTANDSVSWTKDITAYNISSATKMVLTLKKWSTALTFGKIAEFYTTYKTTLYGDDIISIDVLEESEVTTGTLPVGNISSNEIRLTLQNINRVVSGVNTKHPYIPANPNTILQNMIRPNRKIIPYIGFGLPDNSKEYVRMGTFWTMDWDVSQFSGEATVQARDRMEILRQNEFTLPQVYTSITLYDFAEVILNLAKNTIPMYDLAWSISTDLQLINIQYASFDKSTYFEALKNIAAACLGRVYMSKNDVLIIEVPS